MQYLVVTHEFTVENLPPQGHILPSVESIDWDLCMEQVRNTSKRQASKSPKGVRTGSLSSRDFFCVLKSLPQQQLSDVSKRNSYHHFLLISLIKIND